jgi:anti-sigma B factor antagonist
MRINVEQRDNIAIVKISGDIKFSTYSEFVDSISGLIQQGHNQILLSWENVDYFDSSALGALISIRKQVEKIPDGQLAIYTPHEEHLNVFRKINLFSFFEISSEMSSALESFSKKTIRVR